jgi:hypothetical protein
VANTTRTFLEAAIAKAAMRVAMLLLRRVLFDTNACSSVGASFVCYRCRFLASFGFWYTSQSLLLAVVDWRTTYDS